jgi:flagellar hook-associated protein 1 FlgK
MSLFDAISTARSGLIATQSAIDVASRNIANASVEGYTRKIQEQSTRVVDGRAGAVKVEEVTRNVNAQLQRDVREQSSVVEELTIIEDFLSRLELEFGRPEDSSSVASKVTELKKAFQSLATNPDQSTAQNDVISAAEELALALTTLSDSIQALRAEADQRIGDSVDAINEALQNIDSLNAEIGARKTLGQSTADLEDKRDVWVQKLSEQMDIRTFERSDGQLAVLTGDSQFLIDQAAVTLTFSPSASVTPGSAVNDIMLDNGYLAPFAITSSFSDGTVAGLVQLRDTLMPLAQDQLDSLAFELAQQFDSVTVGATTADLDLFTDSTNTVPGASAGFSAQILSDVGEGHQRGIDGLGLHLGVLDRRDVRIDAGPLLLEIDQQTHILAIEPAVDLGALAGRDLQLRVGDLTLDRCDRVVDPQVLSDGRNTHGASSR